MRHDRIQFRQLIAVGLDKCQLVLSNVVLEIDGLVLRHGGELPNALTHLLGIHMQAVGNDVGICQKIGRPMVSSAFRCRKTW